MKKCQIPRRNPYEFLKEQGRHIVWQEQKVSREDRINIKGHMPCLIWLTGLSGAGKSTIANGVEEVLNKR